MVYRDCNGMTNYEPCHSAACEPLISSYVVASKRAAVSTRYLNCTDMGLTWCPSRL